MYRDDWQINKNTILNKNLTVFDFLKLLKKQLLMGGV
jgi:hypothetical protein